jgi:hypothetical protein
VASATHPRLLVIWRKVEDLFASRIPRGARNRREQRPALSSLACEPLRPRFQAEDSAQTELHPDETFSYASARASNASALGYGASFFQKTLCDRELLKNVCTESQRCIVAHKNSATNSCSTARDTPDALDGSCEASATTQRCDPTKIENARDRCSAPPRQFSKTKSPELFRSIRAFWE